MSDEEKELKETEKLSEEKDDNNEIKEKKAKKETFFSKLSTGKKAGLIAGVIVLIIILVGGIYCGVTDQNPIQAFNTAFNKNDEKIIGIWESDANPGISAYVFNNDGTCDQYVLTAAFHWDYEINGNKLSMINSETSKENVYQITVTGDKLTMKLIVQDDKKVDDGETLLYNKVEELNQKTLVDAIQNLKDSTTTEATD